MIVYGVSMAGKSANNQGLIEFDGIYLDPKYSLLVNDLKSRGITNLNQVRQTAVFSYVTENKLCPPNDTHAFIREFRTLTNESGNGVRSFKRWDDALAKKVLVKKLFDQSSAAICEANDVKSLYDLLTLPKNKFSAISQKSGTIEEFLSSVSKLPVSCLKISTRIVNILYRNGIQTTEQLLMTGCAFLLQLPGMNDLLMNEIINSLDKIPEAIEYFKNISHTKVPDFGNSTSTEERKSETGNSETAKHFDNATEKKPEYQTQLMFPIDGFTEISSSDKSNDDSNLQASRVEKTVLESDVKPDFSTISVSDEDQTSVISVEDAENEKDILNTSFDPEIVESIRALLEKMTHVKPYGVSPAFLSDRINHALSPSQVMKVLEESKWALETQDNSFVYVSEVNKDIDDIPVKATESDQLSHELDVSEELTNDSIPDKNVSDSPVGKPKWNEYEAAILLDAYLKVREHPEQRRKLVQQVSDQLRQMAINQGMQISDTYRNYVGIDRQMSSIETTWTGEKPSGHATATKLFTEIVTIYRSDQSKFMKILNEAIKLSQSSEERNDIEQNFRNFLELSCTEERITEIIEGLKNIESIAVEYKWGQCVLFGNDPQISFSSLKTIQENMIYSDFYTKENRSILRIFSKYLKNNYGFEILDSVDNPEPIFDDKQPEKIITRDEFKEFLSNRGVVDRKITLWLTYLGILADKCGINKIYDIGQQEAKNISEKLENKLNLTEPQSNEKRNALYAYKEYANDIKIITEKPLIEENFRAFLKERHYSENEITEIVGCIYQIEAYAHKRHWFKYKLFGDSINLSYDLYLTTQRIINKSDIDTFQNRKALNAFGVFLKQNNSELNNPIEQPISSVQLPVQPSIIPISLPIATDSLVEQIEKILIEKETNGMTIYDLKKLLGKNQYEIQDAISKSENIIEIKLRLYHKEAFIDIDDAADQLESILQKLILQNDNIASSALLFRYAHSEMNMFLNDNDLDDSQSVYDLAKHFFMKCHYHGKSYNFSDNTYITTPDIKINKFLDLVIYFGKSLNRPFKQDELIEYLGKLELPTSNLHGKMQIGVKPVVFFYDTKEYLIVESMNLDDAFMSQAKNALTRLLEDTGEYVILRNITDIWYYQMPVLPYNLNWTPLLLQQVLHFYGNKIGYRTIPAMDNQYLDTLHAVLVPNNSWIKDFRDAAAIFLLENYPDQKTFEAEELRQIFVKSGMIKGNELIWNMHKALGKDPRFIWDSDGSHVRVELS